jgi:hypothetical protein
MEGLRLGEARGAKVAKMAKVAKIAGNRSFVSESIRPGTGDGRKGRAHSHALPTFTPAQ